MLYQHCLHVLCLLCTDNNIRWPYGYALDQPTTQNRRRLGGYTNERMGMIEMLFAQCICGIIWGLFSAQPLLIMSATGPVLIFEASMFAVSHSGVRVDNARIAKSIHRFIRKTRDILYASK